MAKLGTSVGVVTSWTDLSGPRGSGEKERGVTAIHRCDQARKSTWWMPWRPEAKKDVVGCDKLRGVVKQALIRRSLNGETPYRPISGMTRT